MGCYPLYWSSYKNKSCCELWLWRIQFYKQHWLCSCVSLCPLILFQCKYLHFTLGTVSMVFFNWHLKLNLREFLHTKTSFDNCTKKRRNKYLSSIHSFYQGLLICQVPVFQMSNIINKYLCQTSGQWRRLIKNEFDIIMFWHGVNF